jgi:acetoin utilization protein AcuB
VLSQRDLGVAGQRDFREKHVVSDLMNTHVVTVGPEASVKQAANLMRGRTIGCLPVVEEGPRNRLVGIVTVSDLLELLGRGIDRPAPGKRVNLRTRGPRVAPKVKRMR